MVSVLPLKSPPGSSTDDRVFNSRMDHLPSVPLTSTNCSSAVQFTGIINDGFFNHHMGHLPSIPMTSTICSSAEMT